MKQDKYDVHRGHGVPKLRYQSTTSQGSREDESQGTSSPFDSSYLIVHFFIEAAC